VTKLLTNEQEKRICKKYSAYDDTGHVHCNDCPLNYKHYDGMDYLECKYYMHYNRHTRKWEPDEEDKENGKAE
jgi:hypothetical protein